MILTIKTSRVIAGAMALIVSGCGLSTLAEDGKLGQKITQKFAPKKEAFMQEFYEEVKATPEQRKKMDDLHTQFESEVKPLRQTLWDKKKSLMVYVVSPQSSEAEAMQKEAEIEQLKSKMDKLYVQHAFQKKAVLNPEQQQKAADFFKKKSDEWHHKMEEKESTEQKGT